jgi:ABC-type thiamine transport system substrate-binding protein
VLPVELWPRRGIVVTWRMPMTENLKLPRKLSDEKKPPPPRRPSHADVIENLDRWANSPGLQPPKSSEAKSA